MLIKNSYASHMLDDTWQIYIGLEEFPPTQFGGNFYP
jgi:hypothetical protein